MDQREGEEVRRILGTSKEDILLLASDPVICKAICKALQAGGYSVLEAHNLGTALEWMKNCNPRLLIVRPYTEYMSGHDAAVYLRSILPGIPVLILGGVLDDPDLEARETAHKFAIFPKPFPAAELLAQVKSLIAGTGKR